MGQCPFRFDSIGQLSESLSQRNGLLEVLCGRFLQLIFPLQELLFDREKVGGDEAGVFEELGELQWLIHAVGFIFANYNSD